MEDKHAPNGMARRAFGALSAYQFESLAGTRHAVFTRVGGISPAPWRGLNLGGTVGDDPANVAANFESACRALGISPRQTAQVRQVHGKRVVVARPADGGQVLGQADALVSNSSGVFLTLRFADCTPLLFFDPVAGAVGAGHAGWRGTMQNVVAAVVQAMHTEFGSRPADIRMVIGPSIGPCCYQVGDDVRHAAQTAFDEPEPLFDHRPDGMYFDMWQANRRQARQAGIAQVTVSELCTACRTDEFFSHRAEKGRAGRFGAFIGLPPAGESE